MPSRAEDLRQRTEAFAVAVVKFRETLPSTVAGRRIAQQLLDAATSVAANYRAACKAHTRPLFVSKLALVAEEADESEFWLRLIIKTGLQDGRTAAPLEREAHELACIFVASLRTAKARQPTRAVSNQQSSTF